ncbi:MAG: FtsX-like permease family protein [Maricaulaceae bacterium]
MSDVSLVLHNLFRNKLRVILMMISIVIAFLLFAPLAAFNKAWNAAPDLAAANRLMTLNKINFTLPLPSAYINQVRGMEGVTGVSWANWFGGYYQDPRAMVQTFAVDPETYLDAYPEMIMPDDQRRDFLADRNSILVGEAIANQYDWSVGDTIPMKSNIFTDYQGGNTWEFRIAAIFEGEEANTLTNYAIFHWERFNESSPMIGDMIGWMIVTTEDPAVNEEVIERIDARFANSPFETETNTEAAFNQGFLEQIGNISLIITSVVSASFATILMIVGTTEVMSIRERTKEIAVMKTIGFPPGRIFRLVIAETLMLALIAGLAGFALGTLMVGQTSGVLAQFAPSIAMTGDIVLAAVAIMVALGLITGLLPAWNAMRVGIATAFAKG